MEGEGRGGGRGRGAGAAAGWVRVGVRGAGRRGFGGEGGGAGGTWVRGPCRVPVGHCCRAVELNNALALASATIKKAADVPGGTWRPAVACSRRRLRRVSTLGTLSSCRESRCDQRTAPSRMCGAGGSFLYASRLRWSVLAT